MELHAIGRLVLSYWFCIESELDAFSLIFVQFTTAKFLLSFLLERDDDKTDKNVNHKESNDDDVYDVIDANQRTVVENWTNTGCCRVNGIVKNA